MITTNERGSISYFINFAFTANVLLTGATDVGDSKLFTVANSLRNVSASAVGLLFGENGKEDEKVRGEWCEVRVKNGVVF